MDETELHAFHVAITFFILCIFFLEGEKKMERESNGDKKMHGFPFHQLNDDFKTYRIIHKLVYSDYGADYIKIYITR